MMKTFRLFHENPPILPSTVVRKGDQIGLVVRVHGPKPIRGLKATTFDWDKYSLWVDWDDGNEPAFERISDLIVED